jgi:hypothetical protein
VREMSARSAHRRRHRRVLQALCVLGFLTLLTGCEGMWTYRTEGDFFGVGSAEVSTSSTEAQTWTLVEDGVLWSSGGGRVSEGTARVVFEDADDRRLTIELTGSGNDPNEPPSSMAPRYRAGR